MIGKILGITSQARQLTELMVLYVGLDRAIPCEELEVMTNSAVPFVALAAICSMKLAIR
jgi:hypothetical protein